MTWKTDWACKRVNKALRKVANEHRNNDLRADDTDVRNAVAELLRQVARDCAMIVTETDIEWTARVYRRDEDAHATLLSAARRIKEEFPDA